MRRVQWLILSFLIAVAAGIAVQKFVLKRPVLSNTQTTAQKNSLLDESGREKLPGGGPDPGGDSAPAPLGEEENGAQRRDDMHPNGQVEAGPAPVPGESTDTLKEEADDALSRLAEIGTPGSSTTTTLPVAPMTTVRGSTTMTTLSSAISERVPEGFEMEPTNTSQKRERELIERVNKQEQDLLGLTQQIAEYERRVRDLGKNDSGELKGMLTASEERVLRLETELDSKSKVEHENAELRVQVKKLERQLAEKDVTSEDRRALEERLRQSIEKSRKAEKENEQLRRVTTDLERRLKNLEDVRVADSEEKERVLMHQLTQARKDYSVAQDAIADLKDQYNRVDKTLTEKSAQLTTIRGEFETKNKESDTLAVQLAEAERQLDKFKGMQDEFVSVKSQLMLAQEQLRALSSSRTTTMSTPAPVETQTMRTMPRKSLPSAPLSPPGAAPPVTQQPAPPVTQPVMPRSDVLIVEVLAAKVNLRSGPGDENSPVMQVEKGYKLTVESREGDWYRVITPFGTRAYIRADLVQALDATGRPKPPTPSTPPAQPATPRVDDEQKAFENLRSGITPR